jgi:glyoxylase-like metal-dependent hydrolase (beta-lactamase superfamily II)
MWAAQAVHANPFEYSWVQLAPHVWAGIRQDPFELPQEGNCAFVVTDEGVVLFDAGGSPLMGEAIVAKVRAATDKPITVVVISHWHGDHMRGLQSIRAAFPHARIFSHPHAREFISATQDKWLKRRVSMVPNIRKGLDKSLQAERDLSGRPLIPQERTWLEQGLTIADQLDDENHRTAYVIPDGTFADRMELFMGDEPIQFMHLGKAHTAGDVIMWLPKEKIVATGDIVTAPIPLMPSPYTREYNGVLAQIKALGFTALVPGHGDVMHDSRYLDLLTDLIQQASVKANLDEVEQRFTHGDPFLRNRFEDYVVNGDLLRNVARAEQGIDPEEVF